MAEEMKIQTKNYEEKLSLYPLTLEEVLKIALRLKNVEQAKDGLRKV